MSEQIAETAAAEQSGLLVREFQAELSAGDGRTLDVRIVPFGETATVADGLGGVARGVPYEEEWMPGCFDNQLRAADKIYLNFQHEPGLKGIIGKGTALRAASDGYHGSFKVLSGDDGDKALELVREDVLQGVSVEVPARTLKSVRAKNGVIQRVRGHLDSVALCRAGAFASARVLAMREEDIQIVDAEVIPLAPDAELLERLRKAGITLPDMYALDEIDQEVAAILQRAFTEASWDGAASRWDTPEAYCSASAIDLNPSGEAKTKDRCHLPFKEPGSGDINVNGVRAALARIGQGDPQDASQAQRDRAKAMLTRLLHSFNSTSSGN
jgi:HK97 family phage prohead protease